MRCVAWFVHLLNTYYYLAMHLTIIYYSIYYGIMPKTEHKECQLQYGTLTAVCVTTVITIYSYMAVAAV